MSQLEDLLGTFRDACATADACDRVNPGHLVDLDSFCWADRLASLPLRALHAVLDYCLDRVDKHLASAEEFYHMGSSAPPVKNAVANIFGPKNHTRREQSRSVGRHWIQLRMLLRNETVLAQWHLEQFRKLLCTLRRHHRGAQHDHVELVLDD